MLVFAGENKRRIEAVQVVVAMAMFFPLVTVHCLPSLGDWKLKRVSQQFLTGYRAS
jgi:hypothetical protein